MTLATLELTNGEGAMIEGLVHFLNFMKAEGAPVPENRQELNALLVWYVQTVRHEQMVRVSEERVARGKDPLPLRLLLKPVKAGGAR